MSDGIPKTLEELADLLVREYGRSILDDPMGMSEALDCYGFPPDVEPERMEYLIRVRLGLPAVEA